MLSRHASEDLWYSASPGVMLSHAPEGFRDACLPKELPRKTQAVVGLSELSRDDRGTAWHCVETDRTQHVFRNPLVTVRSDIMVWFGSLWSQERFLF